MESWISIVIVTVQKSENSVHHKYPLDDSAYFFKLRFFGIRTICSILTGPNTREVLVGSSISVSGAMRSERLEFFPQFINRVFNFVEGRWQWRCYRPWLKWKSTKLMTIITDPFSRKSPSISSLCSVFWIVDENVREFTVRSDPFSVAFAPLICQLWRKPV
jgi:hypothetical protein